MSAVPPSEHVSSNEHGSNFETERG